MINQPQEQNIMATKKKAPENEFQDLTDNELGHKVLNSKAEVEVLKTFIDKSKVEAFARLADHGVKEGNHTVIIDGDIRIKKEVRKTIGVKSEEAAKLLRSKKLDNKIDVTATIEIKRGVDPSAIPAKLKAEIEKYFEITLHNSVDKNILENLRDTKVITPLQYEKCVEEKVTEAFKVERI